MSQINIDPPSGGGGGVNAVAIVAIVVLVLLAMLAVYYLFLREGGEINVDINTPAAYIGGILGA